LICWKTAPCTSDDNDSSVESSLTSALSNSLGLSQVGAILNPLAQVPQQLQDVIGIVTQLLQGGLNDSNLNLQQGVDSTTTGGSFQLASASDFYSIVAKFNLARLDADGVSGVRNVAVEGDLLTSVTPGKVANFLKVGTGIDTAAGVRRPLDKLAGVAIRDYIPNGGYVQAKSIQALAFDSHTTTNGSLGTGAQAGAGDASKLLAPGAAIVQAVDTFCVPFADLTTQQVGFFFDVVPNGGQFHNNNVQFTVQSVVSTQDGIPSHGNMAKPSNVARGAVTALVRPIATFNNNGSPTGSVIQTIDMRGDGGSISTAQYVAQAITSTGPLGDVTSQFPLGITSVTAPSIFGSLVDAGGPITGTVQTTGVQIDPITGQQ
jgi:hypothetical protein